MDYTYVYDDSSDFGIDDLGFAGNLKVVYSTLADGGAALAQSIGGDSVSTAAATGALLQTQSAISLNVQTSVLEGAKWDKSVVTWSLSDVLGGNRANVRLMAAEERAAQQAFAVWGKATGLNFEEVGSSSSADIQLSWSDLNTSKTGVVGFTSYTSDAGAMDSGVRIQLENPLQDALVENGAGQWIYNGTEASLTQVMMHEIGHALGFADNANANSIMSYYLGSDNRTLSTLDSSAAVQLYSSSLFAAGGRNSTLAGNNLSSSSAFSSAVVTADAVVPLPSH